jgi:hypothetical protein
MERTVVIEPQKRLGKPPMVMLTTAEIWRKREVIA